jgi:hypothetical protein
MDLEKEVEAARQWEEARVKQRVEAGEEVQERDGNFGL